MFEALFVRHRRSALTVCLLLACSWQAASAQFDFGNFSNRGTADAKVTVESQFTPATADRPALLFVTARVVEGFHIYAMDQGKAEDGGGPMPTHISVAAGGPVQLIGDWNPIQPPHSHIDQEAWVGLELREHADEVTWFAPIKIDANQDLQSVTIEGTVQCQACDEFSCLPVDATFAAELGEGFPLPAGTKFEMGAVPLTPDARVSQDPVSVNKQMGAAQPTTPRQLEPTVTPDNLYDLSKISLTSTQEGSFFYYLLTAFLGGLILNVMPCVLPVIGLKVMSFVQQAGQSRAHALALNCWYAAGIVAVFLALASIAVAFNLGWGTQFSSAGFNISLIGIVFAMALSLLGLWEIPIPGFIGTGTAVEVTEREGPVAAFLKGILTTLLATPCLGPFMAPALIWAVAQPTWMTLSIFATVGLGMASPYLLIGAFPSLIRFLPKPGAWMESFKKVMGLVLLATVVWLLTFIDWPLVVPTVGLMVGIAAGCWWISQTPITAPLDQKAYGWVTALMIIVITAMGSYGWLYRDVMKPRFEKNIAKYAEEKIGKDRLQIARSLKQAQTPDQLRELIADLSSQAVQADSHGWQSFSLAKLGQLTLGEGKTVLVDFTADWCLTCKTLEKLVLKTQPVEEAITLADVVTMEADYTKRPEPIDRTIKALGGVGVPLIAIFPASRPYDPIVFPDGQYTKADIIEAIAQATGRKDLMQGKAGKSAALSKSATESRR